MSKRLSKNTLILLVSNVGSAILSFLIAVLIGRYYGEGGLGIYAGVLAWIFPLSFIVEFGFGTLMTRDIAQQPDLASVYMRLTWQFRIIVGSMIIALLSIASILWTPYPEYFIISSPLIIILPAYGAYTAIFRAQQRMLPIAFLNMGMLIAQVTLIILSMLSESSLMGLFLINTVTSLGQLLCAYWVYQRYFYIKEKTKSQLRLIDLVKQSKSFALAGILAAIQARFSILWLESVSTVLVIGLFVASLRFIDGARMIPNALFGAVYPALSALVDNRQALNKLFIRILLLLGGYGVIVAGVLFLFSDKILLVTFGDNFVEAQPALIIMGFALIPFVLRSGWSLYWYALGREKAVNKILFINLVLLVAIPSILWLTGTNDNALTTMSYAILSTEIISLGLMIIREVVLWRHDNMLSI